jgi:L-glyceraldehyde 3-phosphate reductase
MGLEYVDIFYSHRPDPETPVEETMRALDQAVRSGKALYAGLSNYNATQAAAAVKILRELGTPCLLHQPKYSMFVRTPEEGLLDVLKAEGVGSIAFCPLAQGLLTDRYLQGIPADSRATREKFLKSRDIDEHRLTQIRALNALAAERGQSLAQMALAWVLRDGRVTSALIGASRVAQLEQNVAALANLSFSAEELARIDAILSQAG